MTSVTQSDIGTKRCEGSFGCGQVKPISEFWKNDRSCKVCRTKRKALIESGAAPKARFRGAARADKPSGTPPPPIDNETPRVDPAYAIMPYQGVVVAFEQDYSMVCITDIWRAAGSPENLRPVDWLRSDEALGLIAAYSRMSDVEHNHVAITRRGGVDGGGGTWLPREIALAYAQRLNPDLWVACNRFIIEKMRPSTATPSTGLDHEDRALLREMARQMGILPGIKQDTAAILGAVGSATLIHTQEVWKAQIYICRLINPHYLWLTHREYRNIPLNAEIIFVGKAGAEGNVGEIRLIDYPGKWDLYPEDYEVIATFGTDAPSDIENALLQNPLPNCVRLIRHKTGQKSKTFIAAINGAETQYKVFTRKHYTIQAARTLLCGAVGQLDLFGGAA
jgi:hypothetical protein